MPTWAKLLVSGIVVASTCGVGWIGVEELRAGQTVGGVATLAGTAMMCGVILTVAWRNRTKF